MILNLELGLGVASGKQNGKSDRKPTVNIASDVHKELCHGGTNPAKIVFPGLAGRTSGKKEFKKMKKAIIALLLVCVAVFAQQKGTFTDSRDGKKYKTVKIGEQIWMAENLNYDASGSKCYSNNSANCAKYGRLYNWSTAKSACPRGWHLPSESEYEILDKAVGSISTAGKKLRSKSGWNTGSDYVPDTDEFGFSALPGGYGDPDGSFVNVGDSGNWWSSTEYYNYGAYGRYMYYDDEYANWNNYNKNYLFSVRCLQDSP